MHLVPAQRAGRRVIDGDQVCAAIAASGDLATIPRWADTFGLLADPGRLRLLLAIHAVPGICVTDLAIAAGMSDTAVSQALRLLRTAGAVTARKHGRIMRYQLTDPVLAGLLRQITSAAQAHASAAP
jgi:ArsR family transcriptional regulator, lead/cadmium/zinc/bismuth-responsive transcriptional repressor